MKMFGTMKGMVFKTLALTLATCLKILNLHTKYMVAIRSLPAGTLIQISEQHIFYFLDLFIPNVTKFCQQRLSNHSFCLSSHSDLSKNSIFHFS